MKSGFVAIVALAINLGGCAAIPVDAPDFPPGTKQLAVRAATIEWRSCPPNLPPDCEIAVLEGDPQSSNLFTVRFRVQGNFKLPPHTHPQEERVTVLSGRVSVAFWENGRAADANHFGPGDYYVNARGAVHSVWADEPTELQITGIGPWQANFVAVNQAGD